MGNKPPIEDLVVLLPGISGSVLQKNKTDLWANSGSAVFKILRNFGRELEAMHVQDDDPNQKVLKDGIEATRVLSDTHIIPGLWKIDGYTAISRLITDNFEVAPGEIADPEPNNFYEFPYDWRRSNRSSAQRLKELIDEKLPAWQQHYPDAKVILLAHSMGGLVSRYYLEVLEGWPTCKALITFGTPHRGSVDAVGTLANGFKKAFLDLTDAMRTFPSVYELMPRYPMVGGGDEEKMLYPKDFDIHGIDRAMAEHAFQFHLDIEEHAKARPADAYKLIPVVGVRQKTSQSAIFADGKVEILKKPPKGVGTHQEGGDGTVPRVSAVPIGMEKKAGPIFFPERHSSLQANGTLLEILLEEIKQLQSEDELEALRGLKIEGEAADGLALSLEVDDLYLEEEPVTISANVLTIQGNEPVGVEGQLVARVTGVDTGQPTQPFDLIEGEDGWHATLEGLKPGLHRIELAVVDPGPTDPEPVHDVFEVMG